MLWSLIVFPFLFCACFCWTPNPPPPRDCKDILLCFLPKAYKAVPLKCTNLVLLNFISHSQWIRRASSPHMSARLFSMHGSSSSRLSTHPRAHPWALGSFPCTVRGVSRRLFWFNSRKFLWIISLKIEFLSRTPFFFNWFWSTSSPRQVMGKLLR